MENPGRNAPCPCGSGKKYKQCCGQLDKPQTLNEHPAPTAPDIPKALQFALECHRAGRLPQAKGVCQQVLEAEPDNHTALHLLGLIANHEREYGRAAELIGKSIQAFPSNPVYHYNLGLVYNALNLPDEAIACYRKALAIQPGDAEALNNLGNTLKSQGKLDEAVACYQKALAIQPGDAEALNNLGNTLKSQGKLDEAVACYQKALSARPGHAEAHNNLGNTFKELGRVDEAIACYQKALAIRPGYADAHHNKLLTAHNSTLYPPAALFSEHLKFAEQFEAPLKHAWRPHLNVRDPWKRLKIGYISPDFHNHPVAYFIEPVLANHDKSRVEVFCYYSRNRHDSFTDRIMAATDRWVPCHGMPDDQLAESIRADGIDILVDLAGHTGHNNLLVFARKPAPVQVTYLGYINTTGLSAMDYRLTHIDADPPANDIYYSETLYRLSGNLWWCYRPRPDMPEVASPPAVANGFVTFGSTNNFAKLSPETIVAWADILHAVPNSRLVIAGVPEGGARRHIAERFAAHGVDIHRLAMYGRLPVVQFWELHQQIDIALDPFPYNGGTTTCDALWLGVPVVALTGQGFVSRMSYALLKNIGLPELAAENRQEYVNIAARLANDLDYLRILRAGMRARLSASPLRDEAGFTRNIETAYRDMWQKWCDK